MVNHGCARILGHRGASAAYPENTVRALSAALRPREAGGEAADGVELDVRLSADRVPVVFHDDDTARLTGQSGCIERRCMDEIDGLRVQGEPIPTLATALSAIVAAVPRLLGGSINVELKPTQDPAPLIAACAGPLQPLTVGERPPLVVSSFDPRVLLAVRSAGLPWRLALIYEDLWVLKALPALVATGPLDLHPCHRLLDSRHLATYGRPDRRFRTWTVDDPAEASRVFALESGVTAVITNRPGDLRAALEQS